uniref:acetylglutamate kinase n=1 Tax=Haptolina ericina TaxID=156174 RepID=A0A7S3ERU4_9EUKA
MTDDTLAQGFANDMALLQSLGVRPVVVHGGGPQIGEMLKRLEIKSTFVDGLRVTCPATMEVVEMVLCGKLNKKIASAINAAGGRAVGLSGKDDSLVLASRKVHTMVDPESGETIEVDLGLVGSPHTVQPALLRQLLDDGIIPVIAPVATGEAGASYNVNADTMAGAVANALGAQSLLLLTDVAGVLDGEGILIPQLTVEGAVGLTEDGTASGGMIPKLGTAMDAVRGGVGSAVIMDGRVAHCSLVHLFSEEAVGTAVVA